MNSQYLQNNPELDITILFTGNGDRMIDNVIDLMPDAYEKVRCMPTENDFVRALNNLQPHVVVVCLQSESRDLLRVYDVLCADANFSAQPVIAIGYEDDCALFKARIPVRNIACFERPINREALLDTLERFVSLSEQQMIPKKPVEPSLPFGQQAASTAASPEEDYEKLLQVKESEATLVRKIQRLTSIQGRKSILVVDDDVQMLNVLKLYLQDLYDVTVVPSGTLALKFVTKKDTDLILLDYMMPDMDGPAVLKQIRTGYHCPDVPVVFLTGVSDKDSVMRGLELRPNGYLLKPVSRELLLEKVTEILLGL